MSDIYRITAVIYSHKYRNIIHTYKKEYRRGELKRQLLTDLLYLEKRYPEANIIADCGYRILYEIKSEETIDNPISLTELNRYHRINKPRLTGLIKFDSYEEYLENTPLSISISNNLNRDSISTVTVFNVTNALRILFKTSKENPKEKIYLYVKAALKLIIRDGEIYQRINNVEKHTTDFSNSDHLERLWCEIDEKLTS